MIRPRMVAVIGAVVDGYDSACLKWRGIFPPAPRTSDKGRLILTELECRPGGILPGGAGDWQQGIAAQVRCGPIREAHGR